jgi:hypothetical protein
MKRIYLLVLAFLLLSVGVYGQNGVFLLKIDTVKGKVVYEMKAAPTPGADVNVDLNGKMPLKFEMTAVSSATVDKKKQGNTIVITNATTKAVAEKFLRVTPPANKRIIVISPLTKDVTRIALAFKLNGKSLKVRDSTTKEEKDSLVMVFSPGHATKTERNTTTVAGTDPCESINPETHYFIPPPEILALLAEETCSTCKNDYKVAYDLSSGEPKLCYYKKEKCECNDASKQKKDNCNCPSGQKYCYVPKNRISPNVGSKIGFHIFGYYPSFDSLGIDFAFESRNLELRDQFSAAISQKAPKTPEKADSTKADDEGPAKVTSTADLRKDSAFVRKMRDEFASYYNVLIASSPSQEQVEQDIDYINSKLNSYCIRLESFTPAGLIAAIRERLAENNADSREGLDLKQRILSLAQHAAAYYGYILNYSTMKVPVLQVPNEDMLKYTLNFYRGGKKLHTGNYSMLIRGGWKIDFSTGIVFNTLMDEEYEIKYDTIDLGNGGSTDDPVGQIVVKDKGKFTANIGLMSHIYSRSGKRTNGGLTLGFVFENGSILKYVGGLSLILGYEQRFIISGGVIAGAVDRLDSSYKDAFEQNVSRSRFSAISTAIPTVQKWEFGTFLSLTYNLGGTTVGK